jgi:hypothetical protein
MWTAPSPNAMQNSVFVCLDAGAAKLVPAFVARYELTWPVACKTLVTTSAVQQTVTKRGIFYLDLRSWDQKNIK